MNHAGSTAAGLATDVSATAAVGSSETGSTGPAELATDSTSAGSTPAAPPAGLTVIFDDRCELCRRCRVWLENQAPIVPLAFAGSSSPYVQNWAGDWLPVGEELVVVGHPGEVDGQQSIWVGPEAFIAVLWALRDYRSLSRWLQRPGMRVVARQVVHGLSVGRGPVSGMLGAPPPPPGACSIGVSGACS